jgi:hypothetical protein
VQHLRHAGRTPISEVGALIIKLQAETAEFRSDLGKVKSDLNDLQDKGGQADGSFSFSEARGSLMLLEESIGVRLPRHLNSLIAQIPGVGAAFAMMLPLAGVAAAIAIVAKLIEAHEKLVLAQQKSADDTDNLNVKMNDQAKSLELVGMKLSDTIAKLEGRPTTNRLSEALLETSIAADKLASDFAADFQKIDAAVIEAAGPLDRFKSSALEALKALVTGGPMELAADAARQMAAGTTDALHKVMEAQKAVEESRMKMSEATPGSDAEKQA